METSKNSESRAPSKDENGNKILKFPAWIALMGLFAAILGVALLIFGLAYSDPENVMAMTGFSAGLAAAGLILIVITFLYKIYISGTEIVKITMFGKRTSIRWENIRKLKYNLRTMDLVIQDDEKKIKCDIFLTGYTELLRMFDYKLGTTQEQLGLTEENRETLLLKSSRKNTAKSTEVLIKPGIEDQVFTYFKGHPVFSLKPLFIFTVIFCCIYLFVFDITTPPQSKFPAVFWLIFACVFLIINDYWTHYIGLSGNYIVIKHQYFNSKSSYFPLEIVWKVAFERTFRSPNCITIITKSYNTYSFHSATLRDRHWLMLKKELEIKGIAVINTCIREKKDKV